MAGPLSTSPSSVHHHHHLCRIVGIIKLFIHQTTLCVAVPWFCLLNVAVLLCAFIAKVINIITSMNIIIQC